MNSEEEQLLRRFRELSEQSYQNNTYYFTNFLSSGDASYAYQVIEHASGNYRNLEVSEFTLWGGAEGCERVMIRFGNEEEFGYSVPFPIHILKIEPLNRKFADNLNHRDFLGALMNLGIERDVIGDIVIKENSAYVFVLESMSEYICQSLDKVKHTNVKCEVIEDVPEEVRPVLEPVSLVVSSVRLDAVIAKLYHLSRTESLDLFRKKFVFINGRVCENNSTTPKENDVIAVRGHGKFIYKSIAYETKKGRQSVVVERYV